MTPKITLAALSSRWMKTVMNGGIVSLIRSGSALRKEPTRQPQQIIRLKNQAGNNQPTTDPAQTGTVSCPASDDLKGTSQAAVFKRLIDARYEKNGKSRDENLKNVSVSVHFDDFKTGATHPYRHMINNPDGPMELTAELSMRSKLRISSVRIIPAMPRQATRENSKRRNMKT